MTDLTTVCGAEATGTCPDLLADITPQYIHDCRQPPAHGGPHECGCGHTWTDNEE